MEYVLIVTIGAVGWVLVLPLYAVRALGLRRRKVRPPVNYAINVNPRPIYFGPTLTEIREQLDKMLD